MKTLITYLSALAFILASTVASAQTANVQVIHNSPDDAASIVDIYVDGTLAFDDLAFREATAFTEVTAETEIEIGVAPSTSAGPEDILATFPVTLTENENYIAMASGLISPLGYDPLQDFSLEVFPMARTEASDPANTDVLVYHGSTDAPTVDVEEFGAGAGTIVDDISYGEYAGYLELANADYLLSVNLADGTPAGLFYEAPLADLGLEGGAAVVFASGFLDPSVNSDGPAFGLWAALPDGTTLPLPVYQPTANVQVIHNSPDAMAAVVDIYVDGALALDDVAFREASAFTELNAMTEIEIGVAPGTSAGSEDIIATFPFTLEDGENYIVMATGLLDDTSYDPFQAFDLAVYPMARTEASDPANTDVLVYHGSTDAPTVDVEEIGVGAGTIVDDISYGEYNGYLELANDDYVLSVNAADGTPLDLYYEAPLADLGLEGGAAVVFASGFVDPSMNNDGPGFALWAALPDGTTLALPVFQNTANVQLIHNSPDPNASTVDVYVGEELIVNDLAFRTGTEFVELPAGDLSVGLAPGNSSSSEDVIATFDYMLEAGENYIGIASGLLDGTGFDDAEPFDIAIYEMGRTEASVAGNTDLLVYHGALGAPTVDIYEDFMLDNVELINDVSYGEFGGMPAEYLELATDNYGIDVRLADGTTVVQSYSAPLTDLSLDGQAGVVYASGFLEPENNQDGPAFGLWVTLADGTTYELPILQQTANVQIIHNSPDPLASEVDIYINGDLAVDDLAFRDATPFVEVPAGEEITVDVAPGNSSDVSESVGTFLFTLEEASNNVIVATGLVDGTGYENDEPFALVPFTSALLESGDPNETSILAFHGSPDAGETGVNNLGAVDINEVGIGAGNLVDDLLYGQYTAGYLELETRDYYIQISDDDGVTELDTYFAPLETAGLAGSALVAFASGFEDPSVNNDGPALELWIALPDGTTLPLSDLGETPVNNICSMAEPIDVEDLGECEGNYVEGDLTAAWNEAGIDNIPECELEGILPSVYYSFNTGNFNQLVIDIESLVGANNEVGFELYTECGELAGLETNCVFNASVQGEITIDGVPTDTDMVIRIFTNLDFGSDAGAFELCVSGQFVDNIDELSSENLIEVYPNPSNGNFTIDNGSDAQKLAVDLVDLEGRSVYSKEFEVTPQSQTQINLSDKLSTGIYMMRVTRDDGFFEMEKIVIE
ncbi:DUF4397 domain-containing protein [Halocola ammonii]